MAVPEPPPLTAGNHTIELDGVPRRYHVHARGLCRAGAAGHRRWSALPVGLAGKRPVPGRGLGRNRRKGRHDVIQPMPLLDAKARIRGARGRHRHRHRPGRRSRPAGNRADLHLGLFPPRLQMICLICLRTSFLIAGQDSGH